MIEISHLVIKERIAVDHAQFGQGQMHVLLGPNGVGKSSLLLAVAGLLDTGNARKAIHYAPALLHETADWPQLRGIYQQSQQPEFAITVAQMLEFYHCPARICHMPDELVDALGIQELLDKDLRQCSQGQAVRAHLTRVILSIWPSLRAGHGVLLLDEPLNGLDVQYQVKLLALLQRLAKTNIIIMAVHDIALVLAQPNTCVTLLQKGQRHGHCEGQYDVAELASDPSKICDCFSINSLPSWIR